LAENQAVLPALAATETVTRGQAARGAMTRQLLSRCSMLPATRHNRCPFAGKCCAAVLVGVDLTVVRGNLCLKTDEILCRM
jgi:hypothetical protein